MNRSWWLSWMEVSTSNVLHYDAWRTRLIAERGYRVIRF
jgi:hypothetical protein